MQSDEVQSRQLIMPANKIVYNLKRSNQRSPKKLPPVRTRPRQTSNSWHTGKSIEGTVRWILEEVYHYSTIPSLSSVPLGYNTDLFPFFHTLAASYSYFLFLFKKKILITKLLLHSHLIWAWLETKFIQGTPFLVKKCLYLTQVVHLTTAGEQPTNSWLHHHHLNNHFLPD